MLPVWQELGTNCSGEEPGRITLVFGRRGQPKPLKAKNNSPTTNRPRITTKGRSSFSPLGVLFIKGHIAKPVLFSLRGDTPLALSPREHIAKSDPFSTTGIRPLALLWRCISRNGHIHCTGFAPFLRFRALERRLPR